MEGQQAQAAATCSGHAAAELCSLRLPARLDAFRCHGVCNSPLLVLTPVFLGCRGKTVVSNATRWDTFEGMIGEDKLPKSGQWLLGGTGRACRQHCSSLSCLPCYALRRECFGFGSTILTVLLAMAVVFWCRRAAALQVL
jgi:hypothetical protein